MWGKGFSVFLGETWKKTTQQTPGWKDGQTLLNGTLLATATGLTSTTAVDWHLKVSQHAKNQLNS